VPALLMGEHLGVELLGQVAARQSASMVGRLEHPECKNPKSQDLKSKTF
jgi:hypothetical protein